MSEPGGNSDVVGRKIFFVFPTVVVQNRLIPELIQQEYEAYVVKDKEKLKRVFKKYPNSILFIDIDEGMPENEWDIWITGLMEASDTKGISIGVITNNEDEQIQRKYALAIKVACGYTVLKSDLDKTIASITAGLQAVNAKGRRRYIRVTTERETNATVNLSMNGSFINGHIKDISIVGISCTIEGNPDIPKNALLKDIQIKLQTNLLKAEGIFFGSRMEGSEKVYVILFTQRLDPDVRTKIHKYIQLHLQHKMDLELQ
jgi:hypothetical protein